MNPTDRTAWIATGVAAVIGVLAFVFLGDFYRASKTERLTELRMHAAKASMQAAIEEVAAGDGCPTLVVVVDLATEPRFDTPFLDRVRGGTSEPLDFAFVSSLTGERAIGIGPTPSPGFDWTVSTAIWERVTLGLEAWTADVVFLDLGDAHEVAMSERGVVTEGGRRSAADYFAETFATLHRRAACEREAWLVADGEGRYRLHE